MRVLEPMDEGVRLPPSPPLVPPRSSAAAARRVLVGAVEEPLVPVPAELAPVVVYNSLPVTRRDGLLLREGVVERLLAARAALPDGFGLTVLDGWRSPGFQTELLAYYRSTVPDLGEGFVADPADTVLPPHTTGGAVDLSLTWRGRPLALGTEYDSFSPDASLIALEDTPGPGRDGRRLLAAVLRGAGFAPYPLEWWHWSYGDQWWAAEYDHPRSLYAQVG